VNDYVFSGGLIITKLNGSNIFYFHQDLLGSTRLVTTGSTTNFSTNYQPFGQQYGASGTDPGYKYTSKPQDATTGLYYLGARYYDDVVGRFLSREPEQSKPGQVNDLSQYGYAQNNPETLKDPTGRYTVTTISDQHCISSGCYSLTVRKLELSGWMDFGLTALALVIATGVCLLTVDPVCGWVVFVISAVIALGYVLFSASDGNLYFYWAHVDKFFTY